MAIRTGRRSGIVGIFIMQRGVSKESGRRGAVRVQGWPMKLSISIPRDASEGKRLTPAPERAVYLQRLSDPLMAFIRNASDTN